MVHLAVKSVAKTEANDGEAEESDNIQQDDVNVEEEKVDNVEPKKELSEDEIKIRAVANMLRRYGIDETSAYEQARAQVLGIKEKA